MAAAKKVQAPRDATLPTLRVFVPITATPIQLDGYCSAMAQDYSEYLAIHVLNEQQLVCMSPAESKTKLTQHCRSAIAR